jgi:hypothetical protein
MAELESVARRRARSGSRRGEKSARSRGRCETRRRPAERQNGASVGSSPGRFSHRNSRISCTVSRSPRWRADGEIADVADHRSNKSLPLLASERSRSVVQAPSETPDGTYRVLATITVGDESYRVFADLKVNDGNAYLRLHRFDLPNGDDWFVERKMSIPVLQTDIIPLDKKLNDVEFILTTPLRLDEARAKAFFGRWGPPAT